MIINVPILIFNLFIAFSHLKVGTMLIEIQNCLFIMLRHLDKKNVFSKI